MSDFTIVDISDDESPIHPTIADTSDDELPIDPAAITPYETFYLDDGNVEVLCRNILFRVHIGTLSLHSPALRRMFSQTSLTTTESPLNGCPRIRSSDTPKDFTALLKMIYLPGSVSLPACRWIVLLMTHLPPGSLNEIKCQNSPHSHPSSGSRQSTRGPLSDLNYLRSFMMRTRRLLRDWASPNRSERASSAARPLIRTRSSTSLSNRISDPRCRWLTIWRLEGVTIH